MTKVDFGKSHFDEQQHAVDETGIVYWKDGDFYIALHPFSRITTKARAAGYRFDESAPAVCTCGNDRLWVRHTGDYQTSVECPECGHQAVVHSG